MHDADDLVQKGCGWMLKEASKHFPDDVFDYVTDRRDTLSRTTLRYAIKTLSPERRRAAMQRPGAR